MIRRIWSARADPLSTGVFMGGLALVYVVVAVHTPIGVFPWAAHDDGLYIKLGASLARGQWLGPFDQFTLMKGPGYPVFLAAAHWLGVPVSLAHALLHCAAVILFVGLLHRFVRSAALSALLFVLLLFHPIALSDSLLRVIRDAVYYPQILIFLAFFICLLFWPLDARRRCLYGALAGLVLGWLWLTREEGPVLVPTIAVLVAAAVRCAVRHRRLRALAGALAVLVVAFAIPHVAFRALNWRWYGSFVGVDFKEVNFQRALKALHSVRSGEARPFVSVTRATRQRIYAVSPAFASLGPSLDGPLEQAWMPHSCHVLPTTCGEIGAGWFMWALRDAVSLAGHYASPARSSAFYAQMADEISRACARGALDCRPQLVAEMPPVETAAVAARLPGRVLKAASLLVLVRPPADEHATADDPQHRLAASLRFLGYPFHRVPDASIVFTLQGTYRGPGRQGFSAELADTRGLPVALQVKRAAGPDGAPGEQFVLSAQCGDDCVLRLAADGAPVAKTLGEMRRTPFTVALGGGTFRVDVADARPAPAYERQPVDEWSRSLRAFVLGRYEYALLPVLAAGVAAFLWSSVVSFRALLDNVAYVVALATWIAVAARALFLALIDASSMPALSHIGYVAPAHYLVVAAAVISIAAWIQLRAGPAAGDEERR